MIDNLCIMHAEIENFNEQIAEITQRSPHVDPEKLAPVFTPDVGLKPSPNGVSDQSSSDEVTADDIAYKVRTKDDRLKNTPARERPRERMHELGPSGITSTELLAILLGSGVQGKNVKNVADDLLTRYDGLRGLSRISPFNLRKVDGVGDVKADVLTAAFELGRRATQEEVETSAQTYGTYMPNGEMIAWSVAKQFTTRLRDNSQEEMWIVLLDVRNRYRGKTRVYIGCCDQLVAKTGEILSRVIERNLPRYALVHNHPSGKGDPSGADISFTERLVKAGHLLDIELVDHVVLGEDLRSFVSMRQRKLVNFETSPITGWRIRDDDDLSAMNQSRRKLTVASNGITDLGHQHVDANRDHECADRDE